MQREIADAVRRDLDLKLVLVSGPRQVGKTTLAKAILPNDQEYLNFDSVKDRQILTAQSWRREVALVVFDELHKMRKWKSWIKGIYDTEGVRPRLLVTGSAQLDTFKRGSDSLAGRFFGYRLHPLSVAETAKNVKPEDALDRILRFGGFPEPFLRAETVYTDRWRRSHLDRILREDLLDLEQVRDIKTIELLVDLLAVRVGSPITYASLAHELQISPHTVKSWIGLLQNLYVVFSITPYVKNVARSILKEPKIYFYDTGRVVDHPGARLENAVACALLKRMQFLEDTLGQNRGLHYVRDKQQREVDFLTTVDKKPEWLIEVKTGDDLPGKSLHLYTEQLRPKRSIQLVRSARKEQNVKGVEVLRAANWLAGLES
jgi:predicted AAA+ superfamily ATPase